MYKKSRNQKTYNLKKNDERKNRRTIKVIFNLKILVENNTETGCKQTESTHRQKKEQKKIHKEI